MGSIVSILLYYYCQSGCQASVVASYLAFHPPESTYTITDEGDEKSFHIIDSTIDDEYLSVHIINTQRSSIPVLVFTHPKAKFTIIFSHGNASDLGGMYSMLHGMCVSLEVNVVGYDYTGYGPLNNANTRPTEKQTYRDIESVYNWLSTSGRIKDPSREIIVYGQSVGSGPSCYLAFKYPIAGLVLHSGIMSGIRVLTSSRLLWCFDIFPNIDRIRHVKCPVFIMHGQDDREVSVAHGLGLQDAVPAAVKYEPWWVPRRGHNNLLFGNEEEFCARMIAFLKRVEGFHSNNS